MSDENKERALIASASDILDWIEKGFKVYILGIKVESGTEGGVTTEDGVWHPTQDIRDEDVEVKGPPVVD
jgi:hypothetical protein